MINGRSGAPGLNPVAKIWQHHVVFFSSFINAAAWLCVSKQETHRWFAASDVITADNSWGQISCCVKVAASSGFFMTGCWSTVPSTCISSKVLSFSAAPVMQACQKNPLEGLLSNVFSRTCVCGPKSPLKGSGGNSRIGLLYLMPTQSLWKAHKRTRTHCSAVLTLYGYTQVVFHAFAEIPRNSGCAGAEMTAAGVKSKLREALVWCSLSSVLQFLGSFLEHKCELSQSVSVQWCVFSRSNQTQSTEDIRRHWAHGGHAVGAGHVSGPGLVHLLLLHLERTQVNWQGETNCAVCIWHHIPLFKLYRWRLCSDSGGMCAVSFQTGRLKHFALLSSEKVKWILSFNCEAKRCRHHLLLPFPHHTFLELSLAAVGRTVETWLGGLGSPENLLIDSVRQNEQRDKVRHRGGRKRVRRKEERCVRKNEWVHIVHDCGGNN